MPDTVTLRDSEGRAYGVPQEQVASFVAQGFRPETDEENLGRVTEDTFREQYAGAGGAVEAGLVGGLSGLTLGASDQALGALGADRTLRHLQEQHGIASGVGTLIGAIAPTVLTGGAAAGEEAAGIGARILAHSPAGLVSKVGHAVSGLGEGAGLVGRTIAGTAGAAAEGALYGGGQYLTETALEDKPLSAEGFVAGMGHGALFAAPIGGVGTLASATLQRAAALFPRSEVSAAAAAGVKEQASSALAQTMRDGDAMVQAAERKLSDIDAGTGMAQAGEIATRRVFGGADPQAIADQVTGATARQEVAQALEGYQQARTQFEDWLATEADPEFAKAFGKLAEHQPALDRMLAGADQGDLETLLGRVGGGAPGDERLARAMRATLEDPDLRGAGGVPISEFGKPGQRGIKTPEELAAKAAEGSEPRLAEGTPSEPATAVTGSRALRAQGTPVVGVPAQDIVQQGLAGEGTAVGKLAPAPVEQPATAVGKRPAASGPAPEIPTYEHLKAQPDAIITTVPSSIIEERGWYEMPGQGTDTVKAERGRATMREGQRDPIKITVAKDGKLFIEDGRNRLNAAIEQGAPIKVRWDYGTVSGEGDVFKGGRAPIAGDDLLTALSGMKAGIDKGENLVEMGAPARDAYRAAKAERTSSAAEHFRAQALAKREARAEAVAAGETPNPFHEPDPARMSGVELDEFFKNLTAPKTRDAYVAANIGRAMREEGSHAAALAKVEREWAERTATEAWAERAAVLEYEGGYSRAEAERIAREEVEDTAHGSRAEPPPVFESKKNPKRVEAAQKAAAASVERLHEIHSAVASNLPQELQSAWASDGYKFLREEAGRIRGVKDRINAASKISEAFTEKYGSASETGRGYEGDRFYRRAEIESKHAESWAKEQERKHYAAMRAEHGEHPPLDANRVEVSGHFAVEPEVGDATMGRILARHGLSAEREAGDATMARILAKHGLGEPAPAASPAAAAKAEPDALAARILANESRPNAIAPAAPVSAAEVAGTGTMPPPVSKAEIASQREWAKSVAPEQRAAKAIMRHNGKGMDMGPRLAREAKVIGDMEQASARLADALGSEAPPTAVSAAKEFHAATAKAQERAAASSAKLGADLQHKVPAMTGGTDATVVDDDVAKALRKHESRAAARADKTTVSAGAIGSKAADVGSALEVMRAIGMHVPAVSHIPVIGPILGLWLKARAVMGIIGRKGGSIGKSTEGLIASKAAAVQNRIDAATRTLLETGGRAAARASHLAGPAVLLGGSLFPGGEKPTSDKPRDLFEARSNDITRAMQPGAIDQAIAQRYPTSDPAMHDAIVAQVQRGIAFLDSKRPKQTVLPGVLPGDGTWKPSAAAIEEFGKFVHAVNDPVSVLEDLAKGHPSAEGAETLRAVYPELYRYAQKQLLAAAPEMAKTLPYPRRVMLSILYQIPVDGTMQPSHAQFLQTPAPPAAAPKSPATTGPLRLGQQTLSPLDQRAAGA